MEIQIATPLSEPDAEGQETILRQAEQLERDRRTRASPVIRKQRFTGDVGARERFVQLLRGNGHRPWA